MTDPRTIVLDTSVILADPNALLNFEEHEVVIPLVVIKELEGKRNDPVLGANARRALRLLEEWRTQPGADMRRGVTVTPDGGTVRIEINHVDSSYLPEALRSDRSNDTRLLSVADALAREGKSTTVVSKDLPLRLLAHGALGIAAEDYRAGQVQDSGYTGIVYHAVSQESIDALYSAGSVSPRILGIETPDPNLGIVLTSGHNSALARSDSYGSVRLVRGDDGCFGMHGRSAEQRVALAHLMDPSIPLVSLGGSAGTGKSVLALAAALELVLERRLMRRIIVFRPILAVGGQDLGYLPGTEEEKMGPWAAAVYDALRAITTDEVIDEVQGRGLLEILPITHIRGRTLVDSVVILDECQNLEIASILTAITRVGDNSRMFLLHDVAQRDNLRVGRHDGISAVIEKLKGEPLFAHVTLKRSERSPIAELASRLLDDSGA
jgi:PhoH-like ATPase